MIVRSPQKQQQSSEAAVLYICPRGRLFALLTLGLVTLALLRFSVFVESPTKETNESGSALKQSGGSANEKFVASFAKVDEEDSSSNDGDDDEAEKKKKSKDRSSPTSLTSEKAVYEPDLSPKVIFLASYPNSGTSYTMTLVERASNLSTATNYGAEVTFEREDSLSIYPQHGQGPFWDGLSGKRGQPRSLPTTFVLTKTHCGGRCIKCEANEYVTTTEAFVEACQRTTHRVDGKTVQDALPTNAVHGMVHLIRNPYHNAVARFHLERRNIIAKKPKLAKRYPSNARGFARYCRYLDETYSESDEKALPKSVRTLMESVPCYAEYFKWTQWHNLALETAQRLGPNAAKASSSSSSVPVHVVWYEDYDSKFNATFVGLMDFLQLPIVATQLQTFRNLPTYDDHFTDDERRSIAALIRHVASKELWPLIQHYFTTEGTREQD
jgi:hypothetical protein